MKFHVPGMSCGHCTAAIDKALKSVDPDAKVDTYLTSKTVRIASAKDAVTIRTALMEAGYPAAPA